jgi:murein L,D-transpeptidase YafK
MSRRPALLLAPLLAWLAAGALATVRPLVGETLSPNKLRRAEERKRLLLAQLGIAEAPRSVWIVVRKAERRLALLGDGREMLVCRVGLGGSPVGLKRRRGDGRTPEGEYRVATRNPNSQFHLFLGLDYPNEADAERGLAARLISPLEHRALVAAARDGRRPSWETPLGGTIGIHGSGASADWTLGCIALEDADIETLWALCPVGTPVRILP